MKNRIKSLIVIAVMILLIVSLVDIYLKAKRKKEDQIAFEKGKIADKETYQIKRENNKYVIQSSKLKDKTLQHIFYDNTSVYLYYDNEEKATLLKYNVEANKVIMIYEDSLEAHGGMEKIGKYYKIGNAIYNSKFKKIKDYPVLEDGELLYPNLKNTLIKTEEGVFIKDLANNERKEVIQNTDSKIYSPYNIKSDWEYILLNKEEENKNYIVVLNKENEVINTFDNNKEEIKKSFLLLDDVPYLLETNEKDSKLSYKIYNAKTLDLTYKSSTKLDHYLFDDTKFLSNDQSGNLKLIDYVTKEEKVLIKKENKMPIAKDFILASDGYSLVLTLKDRDNEFYIFYL